MIPHCDRCNLDMTQTVREGQVVWVCVCCDPAFNRGVLGDCEHVPQA